MKPYWLACTTCKITCCNRFANSLVKNLKDRLSKEMGQKSLTVVGVGIFGMRVMKELLMLCKSRVLVAKSEQSLMISSLIMCQHFLKKTPLNPSGPGAWSNGISLRTALISSIVKGYQDQACPPHEAVFGDHKEFQ